MSALNTTVSINKNDDFFPKCNMKRRRRLNNFYAYLHLSPYLILLVSFTFIPIIFTFVISFTKWNGISSMTFIGLDNYKRVLMPNSRFFLTIFNTFAVLLMSLPINVICGLLAAHLLNSHYLKFKKFFQVSFFLPYVTTPVAIGIMWALLFDFKYGTVNGILTQLGMLNKPINWLGSAVFARIVLSFILIWKNFGYTSVMFLSGITTIPVEIYESASIEGANFFQTFRKITIPMLRPIIIFVVVTGVISGLQLFDESYLLFDGSITGSQPYGGPEYSCLTMVMNFYDAGFRYFDLGFGAALAYAMFFVIIVFSMILLKVMTRGDE